ncbi:DNA-binding response regulator [Mucilaginibacter hurinus]|uniref:DNA-binding response regulator n=1 Tax=Mucilaginibacter hurinus TaxID=2201324 RepID=A0A367GRY7_9SPHI|nr:LuxR C-terminal-related transcriptional regulator [Mucilaginibacter hurinus]RCH56214.1 DNA-binding response regulator [Mucilaginibacter hurinus]
MATSFLTINKNILFYSAAFASLLLLLKLLETQLLFTTYLFELYITAVALIFTALGVWLALKLVQPKTVVVEKAVYLPASANFVLNEAALAALGLSHRELEVLQLMAAGYSNQQIAGRLFVSLNTIKTHSSKIFEKMQVQRRTQAVDKARRLGIVV